MKSQATRAFWAAYESLPEQIKERARTAYAQFDADPSHPALRFEQVHNTRPICSARVTRGYRVLGLLQGDVIVWFWIGSHADYDRLLDRL